MATLLPPLMMPVPTSCPTSPQEHTSCWCVGEGKKGWSEKGGERGGGRGGRGGGVVHMCMCTHTMYLAKKSCLQYIHVVVL